MAYVFKFAEINPDGSKNYEWETNRELCFYTLRAKLQYWNEVFHIKKQTAYLNQVLRDFGYVTNRERGEAAASQRDRFIKEVTDLDILDKIYGWKYEPDRYIDFGIGDYSDPQVKKFLNGETDYLILTFNCDEV